MYAIIISIISAPKVMVPVDRIPIYELRERVLNNGFKLMTFPQNVLPAFAYQQNFSSNRQDNSSKFPFVRENYLRNLYMTVEIIDILTSTKLGEYVPLSAIGHGQIHNELVEDEVSKL